MRETYVCVGGMRNGKSYHRALDIAQTIMQEYPNQSVCVISLDDYRKSLSEERAKTIDEYKNKVWEDIETRYRNDIKILGYLSAENLLKDVHNSLCYFAEHMKGAEE